MNIGVALPLPPEAPAITPDPAFYAREAERLGFESFWAPEHTIAPVRVVDSYSPNFPGGQVPGFIDPLIALGRASAATSRILLGTHVLILPQWHPVRLAKQAATLDLFSGGRLLLAIGGGWLREEMEPLGGDFPHRWTQAREAVQAMKELWVNDVAEYHGAHFSFPPVRSYPKPARKPHPPVLLGGNAARVLERVAAWGDGWAPGSRVTLEEIREGRRRLDRLARTAGRDPRSLTISAFCPDADRQAIARYEDAGVDRVIVRHRVVSSEPEALEELQRTAERVLR